MRNGVMFLLVVTCGLVYSSGTLIPTDSGQSDLRQTYLKSRAAAEFYWKGHGSPDPDIVSGQFGELPLLWLADGVHKGSFFYPDTLDNATRSILTSSYEPSFGISSVRKAISFSIPSKYSIAILRTNVKDAVGQSATWEYSYFKSYIDDYFGWSSASYINILRQLFNICSF